MRADGTTETNLTDINAKDEPGKTALIRASETGDIKSIMILLAHPDIDISIEGDYGGTALMHAAANGRVEAIKLLLEHPDIDINGKSFWFTEGERISNITALMLAAGRGNAEATNVLLADPRIANINKQSDSGATALMYASANGQKDVVETLLSQPNIAVNEKTPLKVTALIWAALEGQTEAIKSLLAHPSINVNAKDKDGITALMGTVVFGSIEGIEALLAHPKIDVNIKDKIFGGDTARRYALGRASLAGGNLNRYFLLLDREQYRDKQISYDMLLLAGKLDLHEGVLFGSKFRMQATYLGKLVKLVVEFMNNHYAFLDYSEALTLAFKDYKNLFLTTQYYSWLNELKPLECLYKDLTSKISKVALAICRFDMLDNPTNLGKILQIKDKKDGCYGLKEHICSYLLGPNSDSAVKEHLLQNLEPVTAASFSAIASAAGTNVLGSTASEDESCRCVIS